MRVGVCLASGLVGLCKERGPKTQLRCVSLRLEHEQPQDPKTKRERAAAISAMIKENAGVF